MTTRDEHRGDRASPDTDNEQRAGKKVAERFVLPRRKEGVSQHVAHAAAEPGAADDHRPNDQADQVLLPENSPATMRAKGNRLGEFLVRLPSLLLIALVRVYQWTLSPFIGRQCRFTPTCSNYFIGAVQKYGACRGAWRGLLRICRCHPFHPGGYDPP